MKPAVALLSILILLFGLCELGFCREEPSIRMNLRGFRDFEGSSQNNAALIETLARFAVQEHNNQQVDFSDLFLPFHFLLFFFFSFLKFVFKIYGCRMRFSNLRGF